MMDTERALAIVANACRLLLILSLTLALSSAGVWVAVTLMKDILK